MADVNQLQAQHTIIRNRMQEIEDNSFGPTNEYVALEERLWAVEDELEAQAAKPARLPDWDEIPF